MKNFLFYSVLVSAIGLFSSPAFSQKVDPTANDSTLLGLPGDNLDLYAVLDLFQKSKTIEEFEKSLNLESTGINNLDLDLDGKVDFIKVETKQDGDDFTFVLQDAVSKTETQDVAVILVSKDKDKKITMQIIGDKDLYGKDYIVELTESKTPAVQANPGYTGDDTVIVSAPATTTTVIVEQAPIVQYVYSPAYVPYYPPYYYGYYPPYFFAFSVMAIGVYHHNHYHYHHGHGGYGYHGNTTVIHNENNFNNYNNSRNSSNTVRDNNANGNYKRNSASAGTRPTSGSSTGNRSGTSTGSSVGNRPGTSTGSSAGNRPGASTGSQTSKGSSAANRSGTSTGSQSSKGSSAANRSGASTGSQSSKGSSAANRQSGSYSSQKSSPSSSGASRYSGGGGSSSRSGGSSMGGGASRAGGGSMGGGGGSRMGGGGGARR